jgi:hypothetical protein
VSAWHDRNRHRYPADWPAIAARVKAAAGWRCEACDAPHGPRPHVLTVDHLHHDPENPDAVLLALCARCHLWRQAMRPRPLTRAEAIARLRDRLARRRAQLALPGIDP